MAAGDVSAINPPPNHIVVYEHTLSNGLVFPLSPFISSTLAQLSVPPGLLLPNSIKILVGFELLCFYNDIPCDSRHFIQLFQLTRLPDHFCFHPRRKAPRIYCKLRKPDKEWKDKFFFLKYDIGMYPEKPLNQNKLEKYTLDKKHPDIHAKFQVSRMIDISKGWDEFLVRDYLKLAQESIFTDYIWQSERCRLRALNNWKKAFEQRLQNRKKDESFIVDEATVRCVRENAGQTDSKEEASTEEEEEASTEEEEYFSEASYSLHVKKRRISGEEVAEKPAPARAKIRSCSNISDHDVEGHNFELDDGIFAEILSGGIAGTPVIALGLSQNLPPVGEGPPADMTSLAADMGKITSRFVSSTMEREEKLTQLKEALDAKTTECKAWEAKFNIFQKEHEQALLKQKEEYDHKLRKCLNEHKLTLSKKKEYEKLLKDQVSEIKLIKEQKEEVDTTVNEVKAAFDSIFTQCMNGLSYIENAKNLQKKEQRQEGKQGKRSS